MLQLGDKSLITEYQELVLAYKLLPPPISAYPAKYWTSISLLLHSYSVGRLFQELSESYNASIEGNLPEGDIAFLIGFLHDLGQKLPSPTLRSAKNWVIENLVDTGYDRGDAAELSKFLITNPAETIVDPLYPEELWHLLRLADRIQGTFNPLEIASLAYQTGKETGKNLTVKFLHVAIPQPFLRAWIASAVHEIIEKTIIEEPGSITIPISTPLGAIIITESNSKLAREDIILDWDRDIRKRGQTPFLLREIEEMLYWNMNCCNNKNCFKKCSGKSKPEECKQYNFKKRDCTGAIHDGKKVTAHGLALIYYGTIRRPHDAIPILPEHIKHMLVGVKVEGVKYTPGQYTCPICGMQTPSGVVGDFLLLFRRDLKTEQWNRKLYPGSLNRLMQEVRHYLVDPLCLGDTILRLRLPTTLLATITVQAPIPVKVLEDVGVLLWRLVRYTVEEVKPLSLKSDRLELLVYGENYSRGLEAIFSGLTSSLDSLGAVSDMFSSTVIVQLPGPRGRVKHLDEWIHYLGVSGVLSLWGFYPLTVDEAPPTAPSQTLLGFYKGRKPLYDFRPSDKRLGKFTPFSAGVLAGLGRVYRLSQRGERGVPAVLEALDYPPSLSPAILEYVHPGLYARFQEALEAMGGGVPV